MSLAVLVAAPSYRLTTIAAVLQTVPTAGTALVDSLIAAASAAIAQRTHRVWGLETVQETLVGSGGRYLGLVRTPLGTVGTVTEDAGTITDYSVDDIAAGRLYREQGWTRGVSLGWGYEAYSSGYILSPWSGSYGRDPIPNYVVTYTGGWVCPSEGGTATVTLPADVQRAAIETVRAWQSSSSRDPLLVRKTAGDVTLTYQTGGAVLTQALPPLAETLLRPWVRAPFEPGQ